MYFVLRQVALLYLDIEILKLSSKEMNAKCPKDAASLANTEIENNIPLKGKKFQLKLENYAQKN